MDALTITAGGLSGGISASLSGGKFWDGARQGLITSGLNHVAHSAMRNGPGDGDPDPKKTKAKAGTVTATKTNYKSPNNLLYEARNTTSTRTGNPSIFNIDANTTDRGVPTTSYQINTSLVSGQISTDGSLELSINLSKGRSVGAYATIDNGGAVGVFNSKEKGNISNASYFGIKPLSVIGAGLIYATGRFLPPAFYPSPSFGSGVMGPPNSKTYH